MRALSRKTWATEATSLEAINSGSLLRIADGIESMAKGYANLERQAASSARQAEYWEQQYRIAYKTAAAYKGQITKLKKKLAARKDQQ
jgi:hypothetical protein